MGPSLNFILFIYGGVSDITMDTFYFSNFLHFVWAYANICLNFVSFLCPQPVDLYSNYFRYKLVLVKLIHELCSGG